MKTLLPLLLAALVGLNAAAAEEKSTFLTAYDRLGTTPDCGTTWFLERKIGRTRAFEMMLTGRRLSAREALDLGIVTEVVADGMLETRGGEVVAQIASGPTRAFGRFKALIDAAPTRGLADQLEAERAAFVAATETTDFREGVAAFLAKRPPTFTGK